jgi:hypothetical protein
MMLESKFVILANVIYSFTVMATVITIVNYDRTVITIIKLLYYRDYSPQIKSGNIEPQRL